MATVSVWTGREARALRLALRMSVRGFAECLGVAVRTVTKWETGRVAIRPRPDSQAILDTVLSRADTEAQARFALLLSDATDRCSMAVPVSDHETWNEDLERVIAFLARQDFALAEEVLTRWLTRFQPASSDPRGMLLYARSLMLVGDMQADRGATLGRVSAWQTYQQARAVFADLGNSRRVAQVELRLAVVAEMSGNLDVAATQYRALAADTRLSPRDRAHARLWIGTALSKAAHHAEAYLFIRAAIDEFHQMGEAEDWSLAYEKLALAHRGGGRLDDAARSIATTRAHQRSTTPLRRVQTCAAQGHILASDPANLHCGLALLGTAAELAHKHGLHHQLASITKIRRSLEQ